MPKLLLFSFFAAHSITMLRRVRKLTRMAFSVVHDDLSLHDKRVQGPTGLFAAEIPPSCKGPQSERKSQRYFIVWLLL